MVDPMWDNFRAGFAVGCIFILGTQLAVFLGYLIIRGLTK